MRDCIARARASKSSARDGRGDAPVSRHDAAEASAMSCGDGRSAPKQKHGIVLHAGEGIPPIARTR